MSESQPQQASGGQQQGQQLLRPDDILKLQCLPEDEKQKYRLIMQSSWNIFNNNPPGSQENTTARQKLTDWSQKFIARERQYRAKMKAQQQQGNQNQAQAGQSSAAGQQNPNAVKQEGGQGPNGGAGGAGAQPNQQNQGQQPNQGQNPGRGQVDPAIVKHVHEFPMQGPTNGPAPGTPEYETKIKEYRSGYLNMLAKQASFNEQRRRLVHQLTERQNNGQELPQEQLMMKANIEKESAKIKAQIDKFRAMQKQWKDEREGNAQGQAQAQPQSQNTAQSPPQQQQQQQPPQQQPQAPQRQPSQPNMPAQPQVKEEPQIKIEGGQTLQPQPQPQQQSQTQPQPQPQFNMQQNQGNHQQGPPQQQHNQQHNQQMPPSLPQQQQQMQQGQQQARPPPGPHSQTMPPGQMPQFAQGQQQQNFHQQQQQRPQINPMQANAHQQSNSPHPQSAASNAPGPPIPLSHSAAVSAANRSYTDPQRTNTPMQQGGQGGNFGSREREQLNNPKMPIPRHLNVTSPQAVHMGQSRPTMSGPTNGAPGPMGQPVIPRPPPFQLEGEGDRVLSKRKLDELVRQVTGGSEEALTPEVEEAVLQLADDFVDNVISNACKLSKLRDSPQLDIRDIQVILERNYNIRIPGYASDEVRTVRKIVPAQGWANKMSAVNAAKVMGGKADF
ncbi:hypothetical protein J4E89_004846 [Alternaria sp. Ai002NY15]|nr:hypothetical protein J4E89_004846 [Alternaria sp. Ai002NY15]